jgi:hypothetical protein
MAETLKHISGIFFYIVGGTLFAAYLLHANGMGGAWPLWWLHIADLPMGLVACLYGGSSFYLSVTSPGNRSRLLLSFVVILLAVVFLAFAALNFWDAFSLSGLFI